MLKLKRVNNTAENATYNYYPESREDYGTLFVNKKNGEVEIIKIAKDDEFRCYLGHAVSRIDKYFSSGGYLEEDIVAWY